MAWSAPTEWERWNPEQLLECPYDSLHKIPAKRYQYHIIKCRKQHPEKDLVSCPFNAKHIMLRPELRKHITRCPEKSEVEPYSYKGSEKDSDGFYFKGDTSVPSYRKEEFSIQSVYEWDREDDNTVVQYSAHQQPLAQPPSVHQDVMSLDPENREQFKNMLRAKALEHNLEPPHYQTSSMSCGYSPEPNLNNTSMIKQEGNNVINNGDTIHTHNSTRALSSNGHMTLTLSSKCCHGDCERPQTFRGKGRARLAEEAKRTQFGTTSNINAGIQSPGFTFGRGRGKLCFSEFHINRT